MSSPAHGPASYSSILERIEARAPRAAALRESVVDLVGNTPLVRIQRLASHLRKVEIYAKLESFNPGGSVKDRAARQMILDGIRDGRLTREKILIDSSSGNTAVAYAMLGAALGYKVALVMPANVTKARKDITAAYGAEHIFSDPLEGSDGAIRLVREIVEREPDKYFYPDQYSNPSNPRAHYLTTAPEILAALGDRITHFVSGIGTSGTIMGTAKRLKEHRSDIRVVAAQPADALHGLEGLKHMPSSLVPAIWRPEESIDEILPIETEPSLDLTEKLATDEGLFTGHSSGGALHAALKIAARLEAENRSGVIVTLFPDGGGRYFAPMQWERHYEW